MEIGKVECHNERCKCEFFPKWRFSLKATRCPNCGLTVHLDKNFQFSQQVIQEWVRYNSIIPLQIKGGA